MIDPQLIQSIKNRDLAAFESLVRMTQQRGLNIAYGILNDSSDAEEVLQEAYLQVYRNIEQLKNPTAFNSWFAKIVTHLAFRKVKKRGRLKEIPLEQVEILEDGAPNPETQVIEHGELESVKRTLNRLPEEYRVALILREWEGYSYQEIGEILNIPLGTVKSRIYSARKILLSELMKGGRLDD